MKDVLLPYRNASLTRDSPPLPAAKASNDRPPIFIYYGDGIGRRSLTKLLTRNAARRIAVGIAKLPELFRKA
jgi:hypothetical protein